MKDRLHLPDKVAFQVAGIINITIKGDHPFKAGIDKGVADEGPAHKIIVNHP